MHAYGLRCVVVCIYSTGSELMRRNGKQRHTFFLACSNSVVWQQITLHGFILWYESCIIQIEITNLQVQKVSKDGQEHTLLYGCLL